MKLLERALLGLLGLALLLAAVLVGNTLRQGSRQQQPPPLARLPVDANAVAATLSQALQARTVSGLTDPAGTAAEFEKLHALLKARYPLVHARLEREVIGAASLLFTWRGSDAQALPVALMAHQDVVPIAPGTEALWKHPPFSGAVEGGQVWGRGALDDKGNVIAQFEAAEMLLAAGFKPKRTIYLVFGHDEEVGGGNGVVKIVELLKQRSVKLAWVLDEGMVVTEGVLPGVKQPLALIGLAEKGSVSIKLSATTAPGHSSMPPPAAGSSAIGMIAAALAKLDTNPMPGGVQGAAAEMFAAVAPELPFGQRLAMSNLWLLRPVVESMLASGAATNALMRTTTAMTVVNAGVKENVLPGRAEAVVNFRILPGDTRASVAEHVKRVIADPRIDVQPLGTGFEASKLSRSDTPAFRLIERTVREVFPDAIVAPSLYLAGSDARHFDAIADSSYRFMPIRFKSEDLARLHGTDERIAVEQLADMVRFYHRLLMQSSTEDKPS